MAMKKGHEPKIEGTDDAWDSGKLGRDANFAALAPDDGTEELINEHLELQPISIRLEVSLIESFKLLAKLNGMSYQPLMRQTLKRFADSEMKRVLRERVIETNESREKQEAARSKKAA